ncbi:MAG TPA: EcsC family protein [Oligoflexus sp.]|uniref:EcsC family protein n=1 Tax=Oligoflexus sp. TaxID=1971216 RepID=UPI002D5D1B49|nr:EcsC family protein [Oligoflexus sp.]HYX37751.1 EcsC family protein [Oligoflexus sp.]
MQLGLKQHELDFIKEAASFLEAPSALLRLTQCMGKQVGHLQHSAPHATQRLIKRAVHLSLKTALRLAIGTLPYQQHGSSSWPEIISGTKRSRWKHTAAVATAGAVGGTLGTAGLMLEIPLTTSVMLRSIASTAQKWGYDLKDPEVQLHCLYVFSLGFTADKDHVGLGPGYIDTRLAWHGMIRELAGFIGSHSLKDVFVALERGTLPALAKLVSLLIPSLERAIMKNILSKSLPVLGALSSAVINATYCGYYSQAAQYHFGLMHLEAQHSLDLVQNQYALLNQARSA